MSETNETSHVQPGLRFRLNASATVTPDMIRAEARKRYGLGVHTNARMGPMTVDKDGKSLVWPLEAIDDKVLQGEFKTPFPAYGCVIYFGHFKEEG